MCKRELARLRSHREPEQLTKSKNAEISKEQGEFNCLM